MIKIKRIELREINLPLVHFFETSFGRTYDRRIILARVVDEDGNEGWGECTCGELPTYSEEWIDSCWVTIKDAGGEMVLEKKPIPEEWKADQTAAYRERYPREFPGEDEFLASHPELG